MRHTTKTAEVIENAAIRVEYVDGSFRGEALWSFAAENGKTRISCRWRTRPAGSLRFVARVLPVAESHSKVTTAGFDNLAAYLS